MTEQSHICPKCQNSLKRVWSEKKKKYYWACQAAEEECGSWFADDSGRPKFQAKRSEPLDDMPCPACGSPMQRVESAGGTFYSCSQYPSCKQTIDASPDGSLAPLCPAEPAHGRMKLRNGKNGPFFSCGKWSEHGCNATRELDGKPSKKKVSA